MNHEWTQMYADESKKRRCKWPIVLGGLVVVGLLTVFALLPLFINHRGPHGVTGTVLCIRQVGLALFGFEQDYGSYPSDATIQMLRDQNQTDEAKLRRHSSNDYFRQLFVAGWIDQEIPFASPFSADNLMEGEQLLEAGETHFAYVLWPSSKRLENHAPLVMIPLMHGKREFDVDFAKKYFQGRVLVCRKDTIVEVHQLDDNGRVMLDGKDFFDWSQPHWGGKKPRIVWPE